MTAVGKRITVRLGPEDEAWIAHEAADEGVDEATFLRLVVNRLRRGRPPLMRMALAERGSVQYTGPALPADTTWDGEAGQVSAEDILAQRLDEIGGTAAAPFEGDVAPSGYPQGNGVAAIPLEHVPRERYNPGRS